MPSTWTGYGRESGCLRIQPVSCENERCWRARSTMLGLKYEVTEAWRSCLGPWIRWLTSCLRWATVVFRVSHGCTHKESRAYTTRVHVPLTSTYSVIYVVQCVEEYLRNSCPVSTAAELYCLNYRALLYSRLYCFKDTIEQVYSA